MKKIILMLLLISVPLFSQESTSTTVDSKSYNRFGMEVLPLFVSITGANVSPFPLNFYVANNENQILSFGVDFGYNFLFSLTSIRGRLPYHIGGHFGFGKMKATPHNPNLYLGYLIEFSAGYSPSSFTGIPMYFGFSPNLILEINQFFFKAGVYVNTSATVSANIGFGFLLKGKK